MTTRILSALECTDRALSVVFVSDARIHEMNRRFREIDKPTDVLSFAAQEGDMPNPVNDELGDVIISLETAKRQASEYGHDLDSEIERLLVHGVVHLMGYDHMNARDRKRMERIEKAVLKTISDVG